MLDYASRSAQPTSRNCANIARPSNSTSAPPIATRIWPPSRRTPFMNSRQPEIEWLIQRQILWHMRIDVIQLEYTASWPICPAVSSGWRARCSNTMSTSSRSARSLPFVRSPLDRLKARFEYLRAIRFELESAAACDHIRSAREENKRYLESFLTGLSPRIDAGLRAGIDTSPIPIRAARANRTRCCFWEVSGTFPIRLRSIWFARFVLPLIVAKIPQARLLVAGSDPPPRHAFPDPAGAIDLMGFVPEVQPLFSSCALFVCPIRSGSGVRVKLLEAFASGIPVVSTRIGAEGLARKDGEFCALADDAQEFAARVVELLEDKDRAARLAERARREVQTNWDMAVITERLVNKYRELLYSRRSGEVASGLSRTRR